MVCSQNFERLDSDEYKMMKESFQPSISIVIPAFDEEKGIGPQIETIRKAYSLIRVFSRFW